MLKFTISAKIPKGRGRAGVIETAHGNIETPAFIPVGTKATVKSLTPEQVRSLDADAILANTYHLYLQPGIEVLEKAGGLGKFMNWSGPTFTDSGGFQAFSLGAAFNGKDSKIGQRGSDISESESRTGEEVLTEAIIDNNQGDSPEISEKLAKVTEDGVEFKSVLDGSTHFFTPEKSIEIQHSIGADIIFAFDECTSSRASYEYQREAMDRTHRWAERSLIMHQNKEGEHKVSRDTLSSPAGDAASSRTPSRPPKCPSKSLCSPSLFGIIQGGRYEDLRKESARTIGAMDFDGFGIGGSFNKDDIGTAVGWVVDELPENKPRHLLGIGSEVADLIIGIENGIDAFDCVAPTRIARNGSAYISDRADRRTKDGSQRLTINLTNAEFKTDFTPIDGSCGCYTCLNYTRAYVAHLFRAKEMLAATLTSIHNLYFMVHLVKDARKAIIDGKWEEFKARWMVRG